MIKRLLTKLNILKKEKMPQEITIEMMLLMAVHMNSKKIILGDPIENLHRKHLDEKSHDLSLDNQHIKLLDFKQLEKQLHLDGLKSISNELSKARKSNPSVDEIEMDNYAKELFNDQLSMLGKVPTWYLNNDELCLSAYEPYWIYDEAKKYFDAYGNKIDLNIAKIEVSTLEESECSFSINLKYTSCVAERGQGAERGQTYSLLLSFFLLAASC